MRIDSYTDFRKGHLAAYRIEIVYKEKAGKAKVTIPLRTIMVESGKRLTPPKSLENITGEIEVTVYIGQTQGNEFKETLDGAIYVTINQALQEAKRCPLDKPLTTYSGRSTRYDWRIRFYRPKKPTTSTTDTSNQPQEEIQIHDEPVKKREEIPLNQPFTADEENAYEKRATGNSPTSQSLTRIVTRGLENGFGRRI